MRGKDAVEIIRKALAETLVFYPFASRHRQGHIIMVECTDDDVVFFEANANVSLDDFGELY